MNVVDSADGGVVGCAAESTLANANGIVAARKKSVRGCDMIHQPMPWS
jgi:hypothetical protein